VLAWYAVFLAIAARSLRRTSGKIPLIALALGTMGLLALASASLSEIGETDRHLWLFHVITDVTVVIGAVWLSSALQRSGDQTDAR
jgi:sulfite exporter TauE/SafE